MRTSIHKTCNMIYNPCILEKKMKYFEGLDFIRADMLADTDVELSFKARFYSIEYIHSGMLTLRLDGKKFYHEAPYVFHTAPGMLIEYENHARQLRTHYWTVFCGVRVQKYLDGGLLNLNMEQPFKLIGNPDQFVHMHQNLNMLVNTGQHDKAVLYLENILFYLCEQENSGSKTTSFYSEKLRRLLIEINRNPQWQWNFAKEAEKLNITLNHFTRLFRQIAQTSPHQFVIHSRIQKASELLFNTDMSIKEIAQYVGIENEFYFSRLFKKKYSLAPTDYRNEFKISGSKNSFP